MRGEAFSFTSKTEGKSYRREETRLVEKLKSKLNEIGNTKQQYWIGIGGGPGSGKTTVAQAVADRLNAISEKDDTCIVIPMDGWHIPQAALTDTFGVDAMKRRGAPWTFDLELCAKELQIAKEKGCGSLPIYSREISDPVPDKVILKNTHKIVLVEGLYLLWKEEHPDLFDLWDECWFVKCPTQEEQIERLVQRSLKTWSEVKTKLWGVGEEGARKRVEYNDVPNMDIVQHCQQNADEIILTD
eukprot:CAMPEP_0194208948 /NCGR_PEP_ID=MMETSP0156-20130528/7246_1 /TAXON_ID=33649 /ORGANISM="Thalassionema nitzschioides, Strain L26-B" /LENGTH=242 /DNA_ID=CAMNT_0038936019 /DNA_START=117 /DNA_END=845 /DNA_ORIENTATION=+